MWDPLVIVVVLLEVKHEVSDEIGLWNMNVLSVASFGLDIIMLEVTKWIV